MVSFPLRAGVIAAAACFLALSAPTAPASVPDLPVKQSFAGSRLQGPAPQRSSRNGDRVGRAYVGGKFQLQQGLCNDGGQIQVFPPTRYQVNSWYYGNPGSYSEKIWWRPLLYKYKNGRWNAVRAGIWSWGYVNIVGMVPSYYVLGLPQYWRTGSGTTNFVPFNGLSAGYYAVRQQAYWERPRKSKFGWTVFYRKNGNTYCRFV